MLNVLKWLFRSALWQTVIILCCKSTPWRRVSSSHCSFIHPWEVPPSCQPPTSHTGLHLGLFPKVLHLSARRTQPWLTSANGGMSVSFSCQLSEEVHFKKASVNPPFSSFPSQEAKGTPQCRGMETLADSAGPALYWFHPLPVKCIRGTLVRWHFVRGSRISSHVPTWLGCLFISGQKHRPTARYSTC